MVLMFTDGVDVYTDVLMVTLMVMFTDGVDVY